MWRFSMLHRCTNRVLFVVLLAVMSASGQTPNPGNSQASAPAIPNKQKPDPPPLPPDVVAPDPASPDATKSGNPVTRTLKRLAPNCINAVFHACWSSPPQKPQPPQTADSKGTKSREAAELYFERGNYRAADSRFREALEYNPNDAKAMFELALCLEKMSHTDEALEQYRACVEAQPSSHYAERSRRAMQRLTQTTAVTTTH